MKELLSGLAQLEEALMLEGKSDTANFFASMSNELQDQNDDLVNNALIRLKKSAPIAQYADFSNEQERLHNRIIDMAEAICQQ